MKKFCSLGIIISLAVLYTGFWFYRADDIKTSVINELKEYTNNETDDGQLKVDDVFVTGFPFKYEVNFSKPHYGLAEGSLNSNEGLQFSVDGVIKAGTDLFGRSYWIKQEGDIHYVIPEGNAIKKYIVKGNMEFKVDVNHPQYLKAFMHPFYGLSEVFYKENPSTEEILDTFKMVSYHDSNFSLIEVVVSGHQSLFSFSNGLVNWKDQLIGKEDLEFSLSFDLNDFEAAEGGRPLLQKLIGVDMGEINGHITIVAPGKNNLSTYLKGTVPINLNFSDMITDKKIEFNIEKLEVDNSYGRTSTELLFSITKKDAEQQNLHLALNYETQMTQAGLEATRKGFLEGIKLKAAEIDDEDPSKKFVTSIVECCQGKLEILPDFTKLGKMKMLIDMNALLNPSTIENLDVAHVKINHFDFITTPFAIKSHGEVTDVQGVPQGQYQIVWENYQTMIHDFVAYFNRIHPIFEEYAKLNNREFLVGPFNDSQEKKIVNFFKALSDDPKSGRETITMTVDFNDLNNITIGGKSLPQVIRALGRLQYSLQ
jgi:hypothetical protein